MAENLLDQQMQPPRPAQVEQPQAQDEQALREQQALIEQRRREAEQREAQSRDNLQVKIEEARRERESRAQQDILAGQQKMARFQMERAKLAEEEKVGQGKAGRTFRFDISTGRYSEAPMTTQQASAPELASEIILQMGVGTAGRAFRQAGGEAPKVTAEQIMKSGAGKVMTKGVLDALGQLEGGTVAMRRYQDGLSAVQSEIEANLETFKGEDGRIVPEKMAEFVAKSENFIPAMMGQVRNYIDTVAVNTNKVIDDADKLKAQADKAKNDALITQFQADSVEAKALAGSGHAKARELMGDPAKFAKDFPDAALMLEAGASHSDVEYYVAGQLEEAGSVDAQRKAWIRSLGTDAYGEGFTGEGVSDRPVESPLIRNLEANVNNALDRAEQNGEDYVKFAMSELTGDKGDMNEAEYAEYVGQVFDAVQEQVKARVGGRIKEAQDAIRGRVDVEITNNYISVAEKIRSGQYEPFIDLITSQDYINASPSDKRVRARAFYLDAVKAEVEESAGNLKDASLISAALQTNEQYAEALKLNRVGDSNSSLGFIDSWATAIEDYAERASDVNRIAFEADVARVQLNAAMNGSVRLVGEGRTHDMTRIGNKAYALPVDAIIYSYNKGAMAGEGVGELGVIGLAQKLNAYGNSDYLQNYLKSVAPDGIIPSTPSVIRKLADMVQPPSNATLELYDNEIKNQVAEHYTYLPPKSRERPIFDSATAEQAYGETADYPYTYDQYEKYILGSIQSGEKDIDKVGSALDALVGEGPSTAEIINQDDVLRSMFAKDATRSKAVAIAYVRKKEAMESGVVALAVGGETWRGERKIGISQRLDEAYSNGFGDSPTSLDHDGLIREMQSMADSITPDMTPQEASQIFRQVQDWGASINIDAIQRDLREYQAQEKMLAEKFGVDPQTKKPMIGFNVALTGVQNVKPVSKATDSVEEIYRVERNAKQLDVMYRLLVTKAQIASSTRSNPRAIPSLTKSAKQIEEELNNLIGGK